MHVTLACWDGGDRVPPTEWLQRQKCLVSVLEAGSPIGVLAGLVPSGCGAEDICRPRRKNENSVFRVVGVRVISPPPSAHVSSLFLCFL